MKAWLPSLLILAAVCLLPATAVGGFALGAAAYIYFKSRSERPEKKAEKRPQNVIELKSRRRV